MEIKIPTVFESENLTLLYKTYVEKCLEKGIEDFNEIFFITFLKSGNEIKVLNDYIFRLKKESNL